MNMLNEIDLSRVDLNLLVVFDAVFTQRHVATAASRLHVSPSAVSHGLRRLRSLFEDPLFLKAPRGVTPTARAVELAPSITEILTRVKSVVGAGSAFDPATSTRRFTLAAPDSTLAMLLPPLMAALRSEAPGVDLAMLHHLVPTDYEDLDAGAVDVMVLPVDEIPPRFTSRIVFEDEFVIAGRAGHPFFKSPTLRNYCAARHVLASITGRRNGYLDEKLAAQGLQRRVALTVPNFLVALDALADSDLLAAVPSSLIASHSARYKLASTRAPLPLRRWPQHVIVRKVALADPGIAWFFDAVVRAAGAGARQSSGGRRRQKRARQKRLHE